ncbi:MAG: ATP-binding cassette domain-containing protein [Acidiferrobacterales bacterium]|nr:ATP-binding cassette domain-containing protein [Acidiferrobacterales bacterium]
MTDNYLIDMHNVTVYRGSSKILSEFSLQLPRDRSIAILGPNGAGKSTLLKVLMRELYPVRNEDSWVRILGQDTWNVWELRRNLGFISQDLQNRYLGYVKGIEVVMSGFHSSVGLYDHQQIESSWTELATRIMKNLGINHLRADEYSRMSTGEQRRFLLARALVSDPGTLVLDEPTSGLDLNATFQYLRIIRCLIADGKQLVLVTHHIHEIPPEVSLVVLVKHGRIVGFGEKQELLTDDKLSDLYETSMNVVSQNGYYQVLPGA